MVHKADNKERRDGQMCSRMREELGVKLFDLSGFISNSEAYSRVVRAVDKTVVLGSRFGEARQKCHLSYSV